MNLAPNEVRRTLELAIALWNGLVFASPVWECPDPKLLAAMQKKMTGPRVEAHVQPPIAKRVAILGKFLDEVQIRQSATASVSFPVDSHRGFVGTDGTVTIHSKMPTVVALFAAGLLTPVGGPPVEVVVAGKTFGKMVLREVGCAGDAFSANVAVLSFRPASPEVGG